MVGLLNSHANPGIVPAVRCLLLSRTCCWPLLFFLMLIVFSGCAMQQSSSDLGSGTFRVLSEKYRQKAFDYESKGLFPEAIESLKIVQGLQPDDQHIKERISALKKKSRAISDGHYKKGVAFYQSGKQDEARREFLLTLAYDQNHKMALDYLKKKLQQPVFRIYTVQAGDTVGKIARQELHDSNNAVFIETFNDIDSSKVLPAGLQLRLLLIEKDFSGEEPADYGIAQVAAQDNVARLGKTAKKKDKSKQNNLIYTKAKEYLKQKKYRKSLQLLQQIDTNYRDVRMLIVSTEASLQQEADVHYRKGISYFLSENLEKAIAEWEEVLRLDPGHLKAEKDLKNARSMRQRINTY